MRPNSRVQEGMQKNRRFKDLLQTNDQLRSFLVRMINRLPHPDRGRVCHPIFHICVFQWGHGKGGGAGCRGIRKAGPVVKQGGHAEIPAGSWLLQLAALEARTHSVQGAIPHGARPLDHRTTTQDGVRSQLAGILGPWLPTACCRAGGRPGDPGNTGAG